MVNFVIAIQNIILGILFRLSLFIGGALNISYGNTNGDNRYEHCTISNDINNEERNTLNRVALMQTIFWGMYIGKSKHSSYIYT